MRPLYITSCFWLLIATAATPAYLPAQGDTFSGMVGLPSRVCSRQVIGDYAGSNKLTSAAITAMSPIREQVAAIQSHDSIVDLELIGNPTDFKPYNLDISRFPKLLRFRAVACRLGKTMLKGLLEAQSLREIEIQASSEVTEDDFLQFIARPCIQRASFIGCKNLTPALLQREVSTSTLTSLSVHIFGAVDSAELSTFLHNFGCLVRFELASSGLKGISELTLACLQDLSIFLRSPVSGHTLNALIGRQPKSRLRLVIPALTADVFADVQHAQISHLDLSGNVDLEDSAVSIWFGSLRLHCLTLDGCSRMTGECLNSLVASGTIRELHLWSCPSLKSSCIQAIANLKSLRKLDMGDCALNSIDLVFLANNTQLNELDLSRSSVTDDVLIALCKMPMLRKLSIVNCDQISEKGIKALAKSNAIRVVRLMSWRDSPAKCKFNLFARNLLQGIVVN